VAGDSGGGGERVGLSHDREKADSDLTEEGERGEETMETAQAANFRKHSGEKTEERSEEKECELHSSRLPEVPQTTTMKD